MKPRNDFIKAVIELHQKVGYEHPEKACLGDGARRNFWMSAIKEEISELDCAIERNDLVGVADAIGDAIYVLLGASLAFGLPFEKVFQSIHDSNLTKDVILFQVGKSNEMEKKLIKGESYVPPDLSFVIK